MTTKMYTVLGRGEAYQEEFKKKRPGGGGTTLRSLEETQQKLTPQIDSVLRSLSSLLPEQRLDEVIIELRLDSSFIAKSYLPTDLLKNSGLTLRGSHTWIQTVTAKDDGSKKKLRAKALPSKPIGSIPSKSLYVSGNDQALAKIRTILTSPVQRDASAQKDLAKIEEIYLPNNKDRISGFSQTEILRSFVAIEIVLHPWQSILRKQCISKLEQIFKRYNVPNNLILTKEYDSGPMFIAAKIPEAALADIGELNYIRMARPLPRVELTRTVVGVKIPAPALPSQLSRPKTWVAVFDGGVADNNPYLSDFIESHDATTKPPIAKLVEHGTAVCSAILYRNIDPGKPLNHPFCGVRSYRVLPDPQDDDLELYGVIDTLETIVPTLPDDTNIINLSFGPQGPIDDAPSRFTYAIDRLSYEYGKLFFVAVGNWGTKSGLDRIQAPSDSVNNLAIGSYSFHPPTGDMVHADYSCSGPGRPGCSVKPDFLAFGGSAAAPFYVLDTQPGIIQGTLGTSFAAPTAASIAGELLARVSNPLNSQSCRALMINSAKFSRSKIEASKRGWGSLPVTVEEILACDKQRVSVLYQGILSPRKSWKLPFLLPAGFDPGGNADFFWTIAYASEVDVSTPDEYTLLGIEQGFRPHKNRFSFTHPINKKKFEKLDLEVDAARVSELLSQGWSKAALPLADTKAKQEETTLRSKEAKWDTIVHATRRKRRDGILDPSLTLTIVGRGAWDEANDSLQSPFAAVLTVIVPKYKGDLYAETLTAFNKLQSLQIRSQAEVLLPINWPK